MIFAMEKAHRSRRLEPDATRDTFTNSYAIAANKLEGFKITTKPAGANG